MDKVTIDEKREGRLTVTAKEAFEDLFCKYGEDFNWYMISSPQSSKTFVEELRKEIGEKHFLYGKEMQAVAKCESNDDVLYITENGLGTAVYYLVHLTYSAQNTDGFPKYREFIDVYALREYIEQSYIEDIL